MGKKTVGLTLAVVLLGVLGGCATGGSQTSQMIAGTYQIARKLDKDLGSTVSRLNETAAALSSRVEESDQQLRELRGMTEENQRKLDAIKAQLDSLQRVVYNQFGLSAQARAADTAAAGVQPGAPVIEQQPTLAGTSGTAVTPPAPGSTDSATLTASPGAAAAGMPQTSTVNPVELYQQAQRKLMSDDFEGAYQAFDEYVQKFPNTEYTANAQFWKAEALFRMAERKNDSATYERAIREYETMQNNFRSSTKVPVAMFNQAVAYDRIGQPSRAVEILKKLVQDFPATPAAERARSELQKRGAN